MPSRASLHVIAAALAAITALGALTACSVDDATFKRGDEVDAATSEACTITGDEDGNGLSDCMDPACTLLPTCHPLCGDGRQEQGEECDDGNAMNGDGCESTCKPTPRARYDVAFVDEMIISPSTFSIASFFLVINRGTTPLNLATTAILRFSDDSAQTVWEFKTSGTPMFQLQPGRAAGALSPLATTKLIDSGLVPEPRDNQTLNFSMSASNVPNIAFDLRGEATLRIDDKELVLPLIIHFVPGASTSFPHVRRYGSGQ